MAEILQYRKGSETSASKKRRASSLKRERREIIRLIIAIYLAEMIVQGTLVLIHRGMGL